MELMISPKTCQLDLVFQEACLAILPIASSTLSDEEFKQIVICAAEKMKEQITPEVQLEISKPKHTRQLV
jgi:hypothetical protein